MHDSLNRLDESRGSESSRRVERPLHQKLRCGTTARDNGAVHLAHVLPSHKDDSDSNGEHEGRAQSLAL